jgi:hypothetical protein
MSFLDEPMFHIIAQRSAQRCVDLAQQIDQGRRRSSARSTVSWRRSSGDLGTNWAD